MDTMQQVIAQEMLEQRYSRKLIDVMLRAELDESAELTAAIAIGAELVEEFINADYGYQSKNERLASLQGMDIPALVKEILVACMYFVVPETLSSAAAQVAHHLGFSDKVAAVLTTAELLAVLCETDVFDIYKTKREDSLMVRSNIELSDELMEFVDNSRYLPPMVCKPLELTDNYSSGYLSISDGLILGKGNNHAGDICLDVLNIMNGVELSLNTEFLCTVEEVPTYDLDDPVQQANWTKFKKQSYEIYTALMDCGNKFYLTHKYDMRGRVYGQGYHVNTEGVGFKKAMVDLHHKQVIEGVPPEFKL